MQHDQTKHLVVDRHFKKEKLDVGLFCTSYVSAMGQLANVLTKGLSSATFQELFTGLRGVWEHIVIFFN